MKKYSSEQIREAIDYWTEVLAEDGPVEESLPGDDSMKTGEVLGQYRGRYVMINTRTNDVRDLTPSERSRIAAETRFAKPSQRAAR